MPPTDPLDPDGIDMAATFIESLGCTIAYGGWVKKINQSKGQTKRILFVTDAFIAYVKDPKNPFLSHNYCWSTLFKLDVIDNNRIELVFKNIDKFFQFRFISDEGNIILRKIFDVLLHEMTPTELAHLNLNRFHYPRIAINPRGVLGRFDQHLIRFGLNPQNIKFREIFKSYLQSLRPNFFLEPFEHLFPVIKQVLFALIASPNTKGFFFPEINEKVQVYSLYRFIAYFAKLPTHVRYIQFQSPIIGKIGKIIGTFSNKTESKINGIGYSNVEMSENDVDKMKQLICAKPFISLRWCNINPPTSIEQLYSDTKVQDSLRYLALDNTLNLNLNNLAPFLSRLTILSLEHCELEIADVFEVISQFDLTNLKMINLSHNAARRPIDPQTNIPSSLQRIDISYVRFSNNVMANIIEILITNKYDNGIKFYCDKYYIADEKEADATLNNFENIGTTYLIEFSWRKNKVSSGLIDFLSRSPNLNKLILEENIYHDKDINLVEELINIFPKLRYLTHLYIVGGRNKKLKTDFDDNFLAKLEELPNLTHLDISNNEVSDDGIEHISRMLKDLPTLSHVSIDNSNITSLEPIKRLCYSAIENHRKFYISYPEEEIKSLLESQKITEDDIDELIELLKNASSSNKGSPIKHSKRRSSYDLDHESVDSTSGSRKHFSLKKSRRLTESLYVNEGHAQNIKKNLLSEYEYQQDPDSIFILPFDRYSGNINDNAFPLYFTEELEAELLTEREFVKPVLKVTPYRSYDLFELTETPKLKLSISPTSSISSIDFEENFISDDGFPMSPLARSLPINYEKTSDDEENPEEVKQEEEEKHEEVKQEEEEKHEEVKQEEEEEKHEEEEIHEEVKQEEEEKHEEEKLEEEEKQEEEKLEEESKSEEESNKDEIDNKEIIASSSFTEPEVSDENITEAVPFNEPDWFFPIPVPSRPSNKEIIKKMHGILSAKAVINNLKMKK